MERVYGISYSFTKTPTVSQVSDKGVITYNPILVYCEKENEGISDVSLIKASKDFSLRYERMIESYCSTYKKDSVYLAMRKHSRDLQERVIAEYICTIIMQKLRIYPDDDLTFLISDEFQSEKIIGRLGYLRLPLNRTHIMFVSRNLSSFMTNYIERYAIPPQNDLKVLFAGRYRGKVSGPYPEENVLSMLRIYFCSFAQQAIYPVRINLFSQGFNKNDLNHEKGRIERLFLNDEVELYPVIGGTGSEKTRLPQVLIKCEDYIENEKRK